MGELNSIANNEGNNEKEKINFYVPDFFKNTALYALLADFVEHIPQWFYDDFKISAAYGSFPNCIWNGGRATFDGVNRPMMDKIIEEMNNRGIAIRFTFTNPLLEGLKRIIIWLFLTHHLTKMREYLP